MPGTKPVVRASVLIGFDKFLEARGVDTETLYAGAGLPAPSKIDPDSELPANAVAQLMEIAAIRANDPCIGLSWAEAFPIGGTGVLGYLFLNESPVGKAMKSLARYAALLRQSFQVHYEEDAEGGLLWWRWPDTLTVRPTQYGSFALGVTLLRLKSVIGSSWVPQQTELQGQPLQCHQKVREIFGTNVRFLSDRNAIRLDRVTIERPIPKADPRLQPILQKLGDQMIAEMPPLGDISAEVRNVILDHLPERRATLEDVAERFYLSPRTLQSRLAEDTTTFEQILNETLKARAEDLLNVTELNLTEIALMLGFSELSAFTRASQRWFGKSPSAQRKLLKEQEKH